MQAEIITSNDIELLKTLQPEGWADITISFKNYIDYDFCRPFKFVDNEEIMGVGCVIVFEGTAWLAHIIVPPRHRKKGTGYQIVDYLLSVLKEKSIKTVLLIATDLGESIYRRAGFEVVNEYLFFERKRGLGALPAFENIGSFQYCYYTDIMKLDMEVTGENRESLIKKHLEDAVLYIKDKELKGYYLPGLGEGLIIASNPEAGIELMKLKYQNINKAVIPSANTVGIEFLKQYGFIETGTKAKRMVLGKNVNWQGDKVFGRIGGNYG